METRIVVYDWLLEEKVEKINGTADAHIRVARVLQKFEDYLAWMGTSLENMKLTSPGSWQKSSL